MKYYYNLTDRDVNLQQLGRILSAPLVDRTDTLEDALKVLTPIPPMSDKTLDYNVICDNKGRELLQRSQDESVELRVSWSGGIDSTNALCSLLKFKDDYPNADIKVCLNQKSIDEYPWFYENIIKDKLDAYMGETFQEVGMGENEALGLNFSQDTGKDYLVVTGEIGDQIFGAKSILIAPELAHTNFRDEFGQATADYLQPLVDKMPNKDESCGAVLSWLNFTLKYQWCQLRMYCMFDIPYHKYAHFFDTTEFQQWSMQNDLSVKFPDFDPKRYKLPAKKYIKDFTGDDAYYLTKTKVPSMQHTQKVFNSPNNAIWVSIDENMNKRSYSIPEPEISYEADAEGDGMTVTISNVGFAP